MRERDRVRVYHKKNSHGVSFHPEKKSDKVRVQHERKSD